LAGSHIQETLAKLGQAFRSNVGYNPYLGAEGSTIAPILARQFKGMKNNDPGTKQQNASPVCIYQEILKQAKTSANPSLDSAIAELLDIALFWCMRSCEYSSVKADE
jgi:hypothetical protein